ncbi:hypothetical protein H6G80_30095 [Nostoc sp. FACHB-87]|uniref:hypothetical protein n=1 Tax=Nostocaceae TaxID=1162 RepID=UPI001687478C|nr:MULTISPECIES: hypothetical protein [Nostocaceae]MBD2303272.1 hypothetical protein [Nostoc sp. FACHB-190]MBD2458306.1 hypothetical protein [Nostoc sp. FACHB-87]MBD2479454.1 hypothetical protein [Anabaena sp. FACHB-83]
MKSLPYIGVVISLVCSFPVITIAAPVVRSIKQTQAYGQTATLQTINVWNGHGVAISFYQVQETIKRVWLDDPSQILVDTDGCLDKLDQNCQSPGAGLIYLRRIKKVNIPGLPQTSSTLLTIITQNTNGDRKAYSFRVAVSSGSPKYSQVVITPDAVEKKTTTTPQLPSLVTNFETVNSIRNGIAISIKNKTLNPNDELHQRLKKLLTYLQQGDDLTTSANKAVISMKLVNKLIKLGQNS